MTDDNPKSGDDMDETYGRPGDDISVWVNYKEGKVGIGTPMGERLVSPGHARLMAKTIEDRFDVEAYTELGYDTAGLVEGLKQAADDAEGVR